MSTLASVGYDVIYFIETINIPKPSTRSVENELYIVKVVQRIVNLKNISDIYIYCSYIHTYVCPIIIGTIW